MDGCNFELCLYSVGQPERTFPLCPRCVNMPEFSLSSLLALNSLGGSDDTSSKEEEKPKKVAGSRLVLECPLPDFHPLIEELTVSPDPDSAGVLILDPTSQPQPKKWRLVSTREPTIVYLPQSIERITVLDKKDDVMINVRLMQIEFRNSESPLPSGNINKHVCCFLSNEAMMGGAERRPECSRRQI